MLLRRCAAFAAAAAMVLALAVPAAAQGVPSTDAELGASSLEAKNLYTSWKQVTQPEVLAQQQQWVQGNDCAKRDTAKLCGRSVDNADQSEQGTLLSSASPATYRCSGCIVLLFRSFG